MSGKDQLWFLDVGSGIAVEIGPTGTESWTDPQFSPRGTYLSYLRQGNLYLLSLEQPRLNIRLTESSSDAVTNGSADWIYQEELGVRSNYAWSPDGKHLVYLQMDETGVPSYPIVDWRSSRAKIDYQSYPQPGDPNPAVRLGVVGQFGGKTHWLHIPINSGEDYIPRFAWLNDHMVWVETLSRDQKTRTLYFADSKNNTVTKILSQFDEKYVRDSCDIVIFDGYILITGWQDGHNHIYLYRFDATDPLKEPASLVRQLTSGNWDVAGIAGVLTAGRTVYYSSNEGNPRQQHLWAVHLDGSGRRELNLSGPWHDSVFSPGATAFIDIRSSETTPPAAQVCSLELRCKTFWESSFRSEGWIPPVDLEFESADHSVKLLGQLILPPGPHSTHSVPLIVNPYGGPEEQFVTSRWRGTKSLFDQVLARSGFAVLHVDNRGMGGRGRDFAQAAYHNFGNVQLSDQLASIDQALSRYPQLDPERLGWWGRSWGGTFTLYAMTHSERFRTGVAVAPVTDWRNYDSIYTERYLGQPDGALARYDNFSVIQNAKDLQGSLLLVHGMADENVHFGNTIQLIQALDEADIPYELRIYPGETHGFGDTKSEVRLYTQILSQFEKSLMAPAAQTVSNGASTSQPKRVP